MPLFNFQNMFSQSEKVYHFQDVMVLLPLPMPVPSPILCPAMYPKRSLPLAQPLLDPLASWLPIGSRH